MRSELKWEKEAMILGIGFSLVEMKSYLVGKMAEGENEITVKEVSPLMGFPPETKRMIHVWVG